MALFDVAKVVVNVVSR